MNFMLILFVLNSSGHLTHEFQYENVMNNQACIKMAKNVSGDLNKIFLPKKMKVIYECRDADVG